MIKFAMTRPMARKLQARTRSSQAVCFSGELNGFTKVRPTCVTNVTNVIIVLLQRDGRVQQSVSSSSRLGLRSALTWSRWWWQASPPPPTVQASSLRARRGLQGSRTGSQLQQKHPWSSPVVIVVFVFVTLGGFHDDSDQNADVLSGKGNEGGGEDGEEGKYESAGELGHPGIIGLMYEQLFLLWIGHETCVRF